MLVDALIILALILTNGLFSGAEIAVISLRKTRLSELVDQENRAARAVRTLRDNPERFLATVQVAITVVSAAAAAFGGEVFAERLAPLWSQVPGLAPYAQQLALATVVVTVSFLSLVLGELVPKSLAMRAAEPYALLAGRPLLLLSHVARPFVWFLTRSSNLVLRLFGDRTSFTESRLSPDEIQEMVDEATQVGSLDARTGEIASRALEFRHLTVAAVMVPRPDIVALPRDASVGNLRQILGKKTYSRFPVFDGAPDNLVGYVAVKDLIEPAFRGETLLLEKFLRPIHFLPETVRAADVLKDLQGRRTSIAAVVDEQGGLVGLVTIEDLVEEIMGEIVSEDDRTPQFIRREEDGSAVVLGKTPLRDVNRELSLELPEAEGYTTIAGLCLDLAGRIPEPGSRYTVEDGTVLEVLEASPRRIRLVRIHPPPASSDETDTDDLA